MMTRIYTFEYSDEKRIKQTVFISAGIFFGIAAISIIGFREEPLRYAAIFSGLIATGIFFYLNTRRIKQTGTALLNTNNITLNIYGKSHFIRFNEIINYTEGEKKNVPLLILALTNGKNITVAASPDYCNGDSLKLLIADITQAIEMFNKTHPQTLQIQKAPHLYTKNIILYTAWSLIILLAVVFVPILRTGNYIKIGQWFIGAIMALLFLLTIKAVRKAQSGRIESKK